MAYTITTHNGNSSKVRRDHNIRNPKYVEKEHHIDPNRPHEIWRDETAPHAYRRIFGPSVREYNAKQKRPDRKIRNYHAEVKKAPGSTTYMRWSSRSAQSATLLMNVWDIRSSGNSWTAGMNETPTLKP